MGIKSELKQQDDTIPKRIRVFVQTETKSRKFPFSSSANNLKEEALPQPMYNVCLVTREPDAIQWAADNNLQITKFKQLRIIYCAVDLLTSAFDNGWWEMPLFLAKHAKYRRLFPHSQRETKNRKALQWAIQHGYKIRKIKQYYFIDCLEFHAQQAKRNGWKKTKVNKDFQPNHNKGLGRSIISNGTTGYSGRTVSGGLPSLGRKR